MYKIYGFLILSFAASSSFAIPCTTSDISNKLQEYIEVQPICFSPCEAAKVFKDIYLHGLSLIEQNCHSQDPAAVLATQDLNRTLKEALAPLKTTCD